MAGPFSGKPTVAQIRAHRRSIKHNVRGIAGLAVQVDGAEETQRALALLPAAVQRRVLRQALAAAARPVRNAMKAGAKQYGTQQQKGGKPSQSIGTTERSLTVKVATSKKNPAIAYAVVGAARGFAETVNLDKSFAVVSLRRRTRGKQIREGVYKVKSRSLKNLSSKIRKARLDPRGGLIQRRVASRYLHLIETGGKKRKIRAGNFMDKAAISAEPESMRAFNDNFAAGMHREFQRMAAK